MLVYWVVKNPFLDNLNEKHDTEIIDNGVKTSRISGFGLGGENSQEILLRPLLEHRPYQERQLQRPSAILIFLGTILVTRD